MTLNNETPVGFTPTTDVENINKRINFLKYYNKKLIDPSKFVPKCWFNDLTNVTFHNSPCISKMKQCLLYLMTLILQLATY